MRTPDFLVIGAARSSTTALTDWLHQHPQLAISDPKETHFLSYANQTPRCQGPGDDYLLNRRAITDPRNYAALFEGIDEATLVGEGSVNTLYYYRTSIETIREYCPRAKMIVTLRNPIDRAYSSFLYMTARGYEPIEDFDNALAAEPERIAANWHHMWHYVAMGRYAEQIRAFQQAFEPDQLRIFLYEDVRADPIGHLQTLFDWLSVDPSFEPRVDDWRNRSGRPRSKAVQRVYQTLDAAPVAKRRIKQMTPRRLRERMRRANLTRDAMADDTRRHLAEVFRNDVRQLESLLDRSLEHWLAELS